MIFRRLPGALAALPVRALVPTAWIQFDGTGTPAITDTENVTSITDNAAGDWTLTWQRAMASTAYCVLVTPRREAAQPTLAGLNSLGNYPTTTTSARIGCMRPFGPTASDVNIVSVVVLGGL